MTFYERIESLRKAQNISQGKLEKELGFSNGSISKWKNSMPTPDRLQKIADYFNVTIDYLMNGKESPQTPHSELTSKDRRDISKELDRIMDELVNNEDGPLFYNKVPITDRKKELLRNAIEIALEDAKEKNKETYRPYKYKSRPDSK